MLVAPRGRESVGEAFMTTERCSNRAGNLKRQRWTLLLGRTLSRDACQQGRLLCQLRIDVDNLCTCRIGDRLKFHKFSLVPRYFVLHISNGLLVVLETCLFLVASPLKVEQLTLQSPRVQVFLLEAGLLFFLCTRYLSALVRWRSLACGTAHYFWSFRSDPASSKCGCAGNWLMLMRRRDSAAHAD